MSRSAERHMHKDEDMSLSEGLERYYTQFPGLTRPDPSDPSSELFMPHDVCHVVFGLGTSLLEESLVDAWTLFGSDVSTRTYLGYTKYIGKIDPGLIVRKFGFWNVCREFALSVPYGLRVWRASRAMRKPWCFNDYKRHLTRSLTDIREEFGIVPLYIPPKHKAYSTVADLMDP